MSPNPLTCAWDGAGGDTLAAEGIGGKLTKCRMCFRMGPHLGALCFDVSILPFRKHGDI